MPIRAFRILFLSFSLAIYSAAGSIAGGSQQMPSNEWRYFGSFAGYSHPVRLIDPVSKDEAQDRDAFYRGLWDESGNLSVVEKWLGGQLEFKYRYTYRDQTLVRLEIDRPGEKTQVLKF